MPIPATLLEQIEANSSSLLTLYLCGMRLGGLDIQQLVKALASNTAITTLNVNGGSTDYDMDGCNEIGDEGAKTLANNINSITSLDVGWNRIRAEGAIALARNNNLISLNMSGNPIGNEGAKAFALNTTLTSLNLTKTEIEDEAAEALVNNHTLTSLEFGCNQIGNQIGKKWQKKLAQAIKRNQQEIIQRRDQFIQAMVILARDKANPHSQSLWAQLPKDIMLRIVSLMDFRSTESIGKSTHQIHQCAQFIFENIAILNTLLKNNQGLKLLEKSVNRRSQFRFFQESPTSSVIASDGNEVLEQARKIQKTA